MAKMPDAAQQLVAIARRHSDPAPTTLPASANHDRKQTTMPSPASVDHDQKHMTAPSPAFTNHDQKHTTEPASTSDDQKHTEHPHIIRMCTSEVLHKQVPPDEVRSCFVPGAKLAPHIAVCASQAAAMPTVPQRSDDHSNSSHSNTSEASDAFSCSSFASAVSVESATGEMLKMAGLVLF